MTASSCYAEWFAQVKRQLETRYVGKLTGQPGDRHIMTDSHLPELPEGAFTKQDVGDDLAFYEPPRLVIHIDAGAAAALTGLYRRTLPESGRVHAESRSELAQTAGTAMQQSLAVRTASSQFPTLGE